MARQIETLLFDFGGTLDADGVAWKERFHAHYRAEGLDMTSWSETCLSMPICLKLCAG
jgi:hypothetical protein